MTANGALQLLVYLVVLIVLAKPLGTYMARVYEGHTSWLAPVERWIYRLAVTRAHEEMGWKTYASPCLSSTCWACSPSTRSSVCKGCCR